MNASIANTAPALLDRNAQPTKGRIVCYMAGGTGINISKTLMQHFKKLDMAPAAQVDIVLIDTSTSNLAGNTASNVYLIKGLDGSGKFRRENHGRISQVALNILDKHEPGDLNIVVSSLGGGKHVASQAA